MGRSKTRLTDEWFLVPVGAKIGYTVGTKSSFKKFPKISELNLDTMKNSIQ